MDFENVLYISCPGQIDYCINPSLDAPLEKLEPKYQLMFAKVKSTVFIDALKFELVAEANSSLRAVIKDEYGSVCSTMETTLPRENFEFTWNGLSDLPYGVYTLEISQGTDEMSMRLVKRV